MRDQYLRYKLSAGASRVLDCLRIHHENISADGVHAEEGRDKDDLFRLLRLNRAIFIKDANPNAGGGKLIGTKLYWPYDERLPYEGGESIFIGDAHFRESLSEKLGVREDEAPDAWAHDDKVLRILDGLPAFDPFLLKDRFETEGLPLPMAYCAISAEEWQAMRLFLRARLAPMVQLALGVADRTLNRQVDLFVDKIWHADDIAALTPLIEAFRLPPERTQDILYGWKGIAYFEKQSAAHKEGIRNLAAWLKDGSAPLDYLAPPIRREYDARRQDIGDKLRNHWRGAQGIFSEYNKSYEDLFGAGRDPAAFVHFINGASENFWVLGNAITRIYHAVDIWDEMTRRFPNRRLKASYLAEVFQVLHDVL